MKVRVRYEVGKPALVLETFQKALLSSLKQQLLSKGVVRYAITSYLHERERDGEFSHIHVLAH